MSEENLNPENQPDQSIPKESDEESPETGERYPELAELQTQIDRRLRDNQKFLDHFLDETFPDEEDDDSDEEEDMQPEL